MRYGEFATGRSAEDVAALINALTLGSGWLVHAVRLLTSDGDAAELAEALTRAGVALLRARRLMSAQAADDSEDNADRGADALAHVPGDAPGGRGITAHAGADGRGTLHPVGGYGRPGGR